MSNLSMTILGLSKSGKSIFVSSLGEPNKLLASLFSSSGSDHTIVPVTFEFKEFNAENKNKKANSDETDQSVKVKAVLTDGIYLNFMDVEFDYSKDRYTCTKYSTEGEPQVTEVLTKTGLAKAKKEHEAYFVESENTLVRLIVETNLSEFGNKIIEGVATTLTVNDTEGLSGSNTKALAELNKGSVEFTTNPESISNGFNVVVLSNHNSEDLVRNILKAKEALEVTNTLYIVNTNNVVETAGEYFNSLEESIEVLKDYTNLITSELESDDKELSEVFSLYNPASSTPLVLSNLSSQINGIDNTISYGNMEFATAINKELKLRTDTSSAVESLASITERVGEGKKPPLDFIINEFIKAACVDVKEQPTSNKPYFSKLENIKSILPYPKANLYRVMYKDKAQNMRKEYSNAISVSKYVIMGALLRAAYKLSEDEESDFTKRDVKETALALAKLLSRDHPIITSGHQSEYRDFLTMSGYEAMFSHLEPDFDKLATTQGYRELFETTLDIKSDSWEDVSVNANYHTEMQKSIHAARYQLFVTNYPVKNFEGLKLRHFLCLSSTAVKLIAARNLIEDKKPVS